MEVCKRVWALHKLVRAYAVPPEMVRFARGEAVSAKYCKSECMATDDEETGVVDDAQVCDLGGLWAFHELHCRRRNLWWCAR